MSDMLIWMVRKPARELTEAEWDAAINMGVTSYDDLNKLDALLGEDGLHNDMWLAAATHEGGAPSHSQQALISFGQQLLRDRLRKAVKRVLINDNREVAQVRLQCPCCDVRTAWLVSGGLSSDTPVSVANDLQLLGEVEIATWAKTVLERLADFGEK